MTYCIRNLLVCQTQWRQGERLILTSWKLNIATSSLMSIWFVWVLGRCKQLLHLKICTDQQIPRGAGASTEWWWFVKDLFLNITKQCVQLNLTKVPFHINQVFKRLFTRLKFNWCISWNAQGCGKEVPVLGMRTCWKLHLLYKRSMVQVKRDWIKKLITVKTNDELIIRIWSCRTGILMMVYRWRLSYIRITETMSKYKSRYDSSQTKRRLNHS